MNQSMKAAVASAALLILLSVSPAFAQPEQLEKTYEVTLQVVIGSNESGSRSDLPASLAGIGRQLKANFPFSNYRVANTFLGRVSNTGNLEYKSVSNILGQELEGDIQTFLDWSLTGLRAVPNAFQARSFRFGARVPIRTGSMREEGGKLSPVIAYEPIGLTVNMIGFPANTPTLVGTISLPKTTGTIFLVATIKPAEA